MKIHLLGIGCAKCAELHDRARDAIDESGVSADLVKVTQLDEIATFGVVSMPGLVIDGVVKSVGRLPKTKEIVRWMRAASE